MSWAAARSVPTSRRAAVDPSGRYHHLDNLYVLDGSLFPTSIGANPQLSIYAVTREARRGARVEALRPRRIERSAIRVIALTRRR